MCERFAHKSWARVLNAFARLLNPLLGAIRAANYGGYYWVLDQAEIATDIMFKTRRKAVGDLARSRPPRRAATCHPRTCSGSWAASCTRRLAAEVVTDTKRRPQGWRVRHRMAGNWVKVYDKASVLRVETVINNPREFRTLRVVTDAEGRRERRWCPMRKGVADLWRNYQVGMAANRRYLDALAAAPLKGEGVAALDALCRPRTKTGAPTPGSIPSTPPTWPCSGPCIAGEHAIVGFRNHDLARRLYRRPPADATKPTDDANASHASSSKLRGHGLVAKVPRSRLYRVTPHGNASSPPRSPSMTTTTHSTISPPHENSPTCLPRHANPSGIGSNAG